MKRKTGWLTIGMVSLFIVPAVFLLPGFSPRVWVSTGVAAAFTLAGAAPQPLDVTDSVRSLQVGLAGSIEVDLLTADLNGDGEAEVLVGTSRGLYILSRGTLLQYIPTAGPAVDMALLDDLTGNGHRAVAVAVSDTHFPNIRVYDTITGEKVWQFAPRQEVFIENLMWTQQQTLTFDIETADVNGDGVLDVLATSGYRVYVIDGTDGDELWHFEASNNLWRVTVAEDLDGDGVPDLAVGGQSGFMYVISGRDGDLLWEKRIAERYDVIDDKGGVSVTVERGVWDILPVSILGAPRAVVSSEDGYARLVDLRERTVHWELQVIEPMEALLFKYYRDKGGNPTSPRDFHFFNLELSLVPDVTGDGVEEVLASAYLGRRSGQQGQEPRGAGLFLINPATGRTLWRNTSVSLGGAVRIEVAAVEGEPAILLPSGDIQVIDLKDGQPVSGASGDGGPSDWYAVKSMGDGEFLLASRQVGLIAVSTTGELLWDYPVMGGAAVHEGDFTGDGTGDILVVQAVTEGLGKGAQETRARVLYVIDGATGEVAWSYVMPYEEFAASGGIGGIQVAPDLNQDGKQDILGVIQPPERKDGCGDECRIVAISGSDGSLLLDQPAVPQTYYGLWDELFRDESLVEQRLREQFEERMERDLPREWAGHEQKRRGDFPGWLAGEWEREEQKRRDELEKWSQSEMDRLRKEGWSESDLASYEQRQWDDFERQLLEERADWERNWRGNFEGNELPKQLQEWNDRLAKDEKHRRIDKYIMSLDVMRHPGVEGGVALVVGGTRDIFILSASGELLWTRAYEPGRYQDPFTGEEDPEMVFGLIEEDAWGTAYRVLGDLNGDGVDDIVAFSQREIVVGLSTPDGFERGLAIPLEQGVDTRSGMLVDDMDGDEGKDILYVRHRENRPPLAVFHSSATGRTLLTVENYRPDQSSPDVTLSLAAADLDGDGYPDTLAYQRRVEGKEGSWVRVLSGRDGSVLWEVGGYEEHLFRQWGYQGPIMPAAPISDVTGDGLANLALVRNLTWQPGAQVVLYDVARDRVVGEVVLEEIDPGRRRDLRWQGGLLVREMKDFNGDGFNDVAVVTALGDTDREKELRLMVVDVRQGETLADFRLAGVDIFDLGGTGQFGVLGSVGEVYLVDVANDLRITSPAGGSTHQSPATIQWTGIAPGSFNQVFVDGVEVARTNESQAMVSLARGERQVTIRSVDEHGRGVYRTVEFTVEKGASGVVWAIGATALLLGIVLGFPASGVITRHLRRRRRHG